MKRLTYYNHGRLGSSSLRAVPTEPHPHCPGKARSADWSQCHPQDTPRRHPWVARIPWESLPRWPLTSLLQLHYPGAKDPLGEDHDLYPSLYWTVTTAAGLSAPTRPLYRPWPSLTLTLKGEKPKVFTYLFYSVYICGDLSWFRLFYLCVCIYFILFYFREELIQGDLTFLRIYFSSYY